MRQPSLRDPSIQVCYMYVCELVHVVTVRRYTVLAGKFLYGANFVGSLKIKAAKALTVEIIRQI